MEVISKIVKWKYFSETIIYSLLALTVANEMWDLTAINGVVSILALALLVFKRVLK
jgi:hypothetical protein